MERILRGRGPYLGQAESRINEIVYIYSQIMVTGFRGRI